MERSVSHNEQFKTWPVERAGYGVVRGSEIVEQFGDAGRFELASIAKLCAALTAMIAIPLGWNMSESP